MMRAQRHGAGRWVAAAVVALMACVALGLSGCGDDAPAPATATVVFTHQVTGAPSGDIFLNDKKLITLQEGDLAGKRELSLGTVTAEFRLPGGNEGGLMQPTSVTLEDKTYLLAFVGNLGGGVTTTLRTYDAQGLGDHVVGSGEHGFQVINLMTDGSSVKIFAGDTLIVDNPTVFEETTFTNAPINGSTISLSAINNATGAPISSASTQAEVTSGGASMIVIGGTVSAMTIDVLEL